MRITKDFSNLLQQRNNIISDLLNRDDLIRVGGSAEELLSLSNRLSHMGIPEDVTAGRYVAWVIDQDNGGTTMLKDYTGEVAKPALEWGYHKGRRVSGPSELTPKAKNEIRGDLEEYGKVIPLFGGQDTSEPSCD